MSVRITERDRRLLRKLLAARWLTTSQVRRLLFPNASLNRVQKRLRTLTEDGILRAKRPDRMGESLHSIGQVGRRLLERDGIEVHVPRSLPAQLAHFTGINDIRVAVETAGLAISYAYACWELSTVGWKHAIIPDFVAHIDEDGGKRLAFEYDRDHESTAMFVKKLTAYATDLVPRSIQAVIVVADTAKRLESLARRLTGSRAAPDQFFGMTLAMLRAEGIRRRHLCFSLR
jgi:hypothetical protein